MNDAPPLGIGRLLGQAARNLSRIAEARLRPLGLGISHAPVLAALQQETALPQSELARQARVEQPSMAQTLSRMARDGLIARTPDPKDRRSQIITLTDKARTLIPEGRRIMQHSERAAVEGLTPEETALLLALLTKIVTNTDRIIETELTP